MNITAIKLLSGEDLICNLHMEDANCYQVENPAVIVSQPSADGRSMSLGLAPYLPYAATKVFRILKSSVVVAFTPDVQLSNEYNRIFGSGIVIASSLKNPR